MAALTRTELTKAGWPATQADPAVRIDYEGRVEQRAGGSRILELVEASGEASGWLHVGR